jgi:hypothetical protein
MNGINTDSELNPNYAIEILNIRPIQCRWVSVGTLFLYTYDPLDRLSKFSRYRDYPILLRTAEWAADPEWITGL